MIYWGRRKTDHWVEPTDCNKFVVWDALWPSPAPAIDTTSQLRHRCSGFVWARHALIEPSVEGHKAVERKRLPLSRSLEDHVPLSAETRQCEELPGFLSCIRPSRRTAIETLGRRPTVRNAQRRQLASHGNAFPTVPRAILVRMDIKTRNIPRPAADAPTTQPASVPAPRRGALCPRRHRAACTWATCSAASARGFRPAAKAAASCCASRTWTIAVSARNLPLN